jgi:hypothetical protein
MAGVVLEVMQAQQSMMVMCCPAVLHRQGALKEARPVGSQSACCSNQSQLLHPAAAAAAVAEARPDALRMTASRALGAS